MGVVKSAQANGIARPHIIVSSIEHAAILETVKKLEVEKQITVSVCPVDTEGVVIVSELTKLLNKNTVLVSVMHANNEIGTVQPIKEIAKTIRHFRKQLAVSSKKVVVFPLFHTDATQAPNYLEIGVEKLGVDLMTLNGSKIYGPKGVGALYVKRGTPLRSVFSGGLQEKGLRPGTENLPAISAFAVALTIAQKIRIRESKRLQKIQTIFIKKLKQLFPQLIVNGSLVQRLPNNVNVTIPPYESEKLVLYLDAQGIYISEKSACKSTEPNASHVLESLGVSDTTAGSIRFSMGRTTTISDISYVVASLKKIVEILNKNR
jgi:cysteine desulfurase